MTAMLPVSSLRLRTAAHLLRRSAWLASVIGVALLPACGLNKFSGRGAPQGTVGVVVENRGFHDVNVYVVRSEGMRGARLGTVNGGATVTFKVRETELQAGGLLQLQARAIGGRSMWSSPTLFASSGMVVKLDLVAIGTTDLSQSQFYIIQ